MKVEETAFRLNDGREVTLRSPRGADAAAMIDYLKTISGETENLNRYPDEVNFTLDWERDFLEKMLANPRGIMLAAFNGDEAVASCSVNPQGSLSKVYHRAVFGIGIRKAYWGQGLGRIMTRTCIDLARQMGFEQLELKVLSGNTRVVRLYESHGFALWGRVYKGFKLRDGSYQDDLIMGMFL